MRRLWLIAPLCVVGLLCSGFLMGEDKKPEKESSGKRVQLPSYYSKLGLTAKQRNDILEIRRRYAAEIKELQQKMNDLRDQERSACANVLNAKQKARLKEMLLGSDKNGDDNVTEAKNKLKEAEAKDKKKGAENKDKPAPVEIKK